MSSLSPYNKNSYHLPTTDYVDTADLIVDSSETPAAAVGGKPASSKSAGTCTTF